MLFITHGIFQISCWMFRQDLALLRSSEVAVTKKPKRAIRRKVVKWVEPRKKGPVLVPSPTSEANEPSPAARSG
jgi:hypothetical protein